MLQNTFPQGNEEAGLLLLLLDCLIMKCKDNKIVALIFFCTFRLYPDICLFSILIYNNYLIAINILDQRNLDHH